MVMPLLMKLGIRLMKSMKKFFIYNIAVLSVFQYPKIPYFLCHYSDTLCFRNDHNAHFTVLYADSEEILILSHPVAHRVR